MLELEARGGFDWFGKKGAGPWFLYKGGEYRSEPDIVKSLKRLKLELWVLELEARGGFDWFGKKGAGPWFLYKGGEYQEPSP